MRIVGGRLRGRRLVAPRTDAIRPTSDRLREALFNVLAHAHADAARDAAVLDLFAGTGALALEALSRGARRAVLVDKGAEARDLIARNIAALGLEGGARLLPLDAVRLGASGAEGGCTLVFCDPPYGRALAGPALAAAAAGGWLAPGALVLVEEAAGVELDLPSAFGSEDRRVYGETAVTFARYR